MKYNEYIENKHYALVRTRNLSARDEPYGGPAFEDRYSKHEIHDLLETVKLVPGARFLVVGTGTGADSCWLADKGYIVTGIDLVPDAIELAKHIAYKRGTAIIYYQDDVCTSKNDYGKFDAVVDSYCLQNIVSDEDRKATFSFVRRHLRSGGRYFIVCAACCPKEYSKDYYRDAATGIVYQKAKTEEADLEGLIYTEWKPFLPVRRHHIMSALLDELRSNGFTIMYSEADEVNADLRVVAVL